EAAERIQNVSIYDGAGERRLDRVLARLSNLVSSNVTAFAATEADAEGDTHPIAKDKLGVALELSGGDDSEPLDDEAYLGDEKATTGIHGLGDVDLFNILCIPPDEIDGDTSADVYDKAVKYCVDRRAMLIVDPPSDWSNRVKLISDPAGHLGEVNLTGPNSRNAFVYYPRVNMA